MSQEKITLRETRRRPDDSYTAIDYDICLDGVQIGGVGVMTDDASTYVDTIVIDEAYQNRGYGTRTLRILSEMYGGVYLAPDNADAQRLYERIGGEYTGADAEYIDQGYGVYAI